MNSESQLDNRLRLCASFVRRGAKAADIGTDHAYLPVWLCRHNVCPSVIAADVNPEPLSSGRISVEQADLTDRIELRLSDGLAQIGAQEADDFIIAGMGGELIARIIGACSYAKDKSKHFILQPMTRSEALISYLCAEGFVIDRQDCCIAGKKCYTVLSVYYDGRSKKVSKTYCYTGELNPRENETHRRFIRAHIERLRKQAKGDARFGALADRLEEFCDNG